jgi:type IV pilus assembly protein PilQ
MTGKLQRDILSTLPTDPVTLDFDDMDVRDILKLLATKAKINVVYGSEVSGTMTLHLRDVPFNEAFMTTLSMQGLIPVQVGENILRVVTPATLATQRSAGITQTKIIKLRYAEGNKIVVPINAIRAAEGRAGSVVHDPATNTVVITDSLEGIAALERLLAKLDVRPQQVLIEAKLVEVSLTKDMHFGIQWDYFQLDSGKALGSHGQTSIGSIQTPNATPAVKPFNQNTQEPAQTSALVGGAGRGTGVNLPASSVFGAFTLGRVTNNYFLNATLTAAAGQGKAKVLSDPKVTTLNGEKASINITTSIPYVTSSVSSDGRATESVQFAVTGIQLEVTPTINADGRVHLDVKPTVSQPSATAASAGSTGAPAIDARTAETKVLVRDGETIVIGGLITDRVTDSIAKIPLLGDIPILGWLFKKKSKSF